MRCPAPFFEPPQALEHKPSFAELPLHLREKIATLCGSEVMEGSVLHGSLSATAGFVLTLQDGRKIFAKGSHPQEMSHGTLHIRSEAQAYQLLPVLKSAAPHFIGIVSDDNEDGWTLGLWDYIARDTADAADVDIAAAMRKLAAVHNSAIPAVFTADAASHNYLSLFLRDEKKWRRVRDEAKIKDKLLSVFEDEQARPWLDRQLDILCAMQGAVPAFDFQTGLIHGDLRLDNILAMPAHTYIVDWPNACRGPVVFDVLMFSVHLESLGYGRAEDFISLYDAAAGTAFAQKNNQELMIMAASMAGFFADQVYRAVPEKMPRLRWMQKSLFFGLLSLMNRHGRIESPPRMSGLLRI